MVIATILQMTVLIGIASRMGTEHLSTRCTDQDQIACRSGSRPDCACDRLPDLCLSAGQGWQSDMDLKGARGHPAGHSWSDYWPALRWAYVERQRWQRSYESGLGPSKFSGSACYSLAPSHSYAATWERRAQPGYHCPESLYRGGAAPVTGCSDSERGIEMKVPYS
jgi:hypothetical protein